MKKSCFDIYDLAYLMINDVINNILGLMFIDGVITPEDFLVDSSLKDLFAHLISIRDVNDDFRKNWLYSRQINPLDVNLPTRSEKEFL